LGRISECHRKQLSVILGGIKANCKITVLVDSAFTNDSTIRAANDNLCARFALTGQLRTVIIDVKFRWSVRRKRIWQSC
jgi:hypothetical protein